MPAAQTHLNISSISIGGTDQKSFLSDCSLVIENTFAEGKSLTDRHAKPTKVGRGARLTGTLFDNVSGGGRSGLKNVSTFTLGGNSFLAGLKEFAVNRTCTHAQNKGAGTELNYPVYVGEDTTISVTLSFDSVVPAFVVGLDADGQSAAELDFSIVINGTTFTISAVVENATWSSDAAGLQLLNLSLRGDAVSSSPSGTSSILAAALNAPQTSVAIVATTKADGGMSATFNGLISSLSFQAAEDGLYTLNFEYVSEGTVTIAATTA